MTHHSCAACSRVAFLRDTVPSHDLSTTIVRLEGELARSRQESAALSEQCVFLEKCNAQAASDLAAAYARIEVCVPPEASVNKAFRLVTVVDDTQVLEDSVRASLTRMMELRLRRCGQLSLRAIPSVASCVITPRIQEGSDRIASQPTPLHPMP